MENWVGSGHKTRQAVYSPAIHCENNPVKRARQAKLRREISITTALNNTLNSFKPTIQASSWAPNIDISAHDESDLTTKLSHWIRACTRTQMPQGFSRTHWEQSQSRSLAQKHGLPQRRKLLCHTHNSDSQDERPSLESRLYLLPEYSARSVYTQQYFPADLRSYVNRRYPMLLFLLRCHPFVLVT